MSTPASGVGGSIGGPLHPSPREIEATAWTMVNKAALGIVPDSLEVPIYELGGNVWKYQSDSSRPTLKPLATLRTTSDETAPDETWKDFFDNLSSKLHPDLRKRLQENMRTTFANRNANLSVLENVMTTIAKGMAWIGKAQQPMEPETPEWERTEHNQGLPGRAMRGIVSHSNTLFKGTQAFLNFVGPNHPNHDEINHFATQGEELQQDLNGVLEQLQNGEIPPQELLEQLASKATNLNAAYNRTFHGNDMQMMGPMFEAMAAVASALSLTPTTPSLFFGLKMATTGLFSKESQLGMVESQLEALLKALAKGAASKMMNKVNIARQMMLMMLLLGMTTGAGTLAGLVAEFGLGHYPVEIEGDEREASIFTFQLLLAFLESSGVIKTSYKIAVEAAGGNEKAQEMISNTMELTNLVLMALTGAKKEPKSAGILLEGLKSQLEGKIDQTEAFVLTAIREGVEDPAAAKGLDIALRQARIALEKEDFEALIGACGNALDLIGVAPEALQKDLNELKEFAKLLNRSCVPEARVTSIDLSRSG